MSSRAGSFVFFTMLAMGALGLSAGDAAGQSTPVLTEQPPGDGTPIPRAADGRADLSGFWNKGTHPNTSAPIEPLPFTEAGLKAFNDVADLIDPTSYCHFPGIPRMNSSPYPMEIIQLPDRVLFLYEYMHNFRVIWTDGREHRPTWPTTLMGDSVGRWDGDTLVIDTVNLSGDTWLDSHGNRHSDELHVIERWRRISASELWYEATIDDPKFYTEPWTTGWVMPLAPPDWELMEYACTDNNRDAEEGFLQPGALDGSGRDGTAVATPPTYPSGSSGDGPAPR